MEECQLGRHPGDSAREEERRRFLPAGHLQKQMQQECGHSKRDASDVGGCLTAFAQNSAHQSLCQHRSPLLRLTKPAVVHRQPFPPAQAGCVTELFCGERSPSRPPVRGQRHGRTPWLECRSASGQRVSFRKSEKRKAPRNRTPGETGAKVSAVRVPAADRLFSKLCKSPRTVWVDSSW